MMPVSRFTFDTVACPVALASNEVICLEALVLTFPKLPMRGDWNPLALFCAEPPVQPILTGEIGPYADVLAKWDGQPLTAYYPSHTA